MPSSNVDSPAGTIGVSGAGGAAGAINATGFAESAAFPVVVAAFVTDGVVGVGVATGADVSARRAVFRLRIAVAPNAVAVANVATTIAAAPPRSIKR
jgi:hypothetical protein